MWRRETSEPRAAALCGGACAEGIWTAGAARLPTAGARARNTRVRSDPAPGRGCADAGHHQAGQPVRTLGYRRITALLQAAGWPVGKERIWRREGLKVPQKQRPRGRLWLNDGSCVRLRPERPKYVWSYDFVSAMTHDGRLLRLLTLIDKYTRKCLARVVQRRSRAPRGGNTRAQWPSVRHLWSSSPALLPGTSGRHDGRA